MKMQQVIFAVANI